MSISFSPTEATPYPVASIIDRKGNTVDKIYLDDKRVQKKKPGAPPSDSREGSSVPEEGAEEKKIPSDPPKPGAKYERRDNVRCVETQIDEYMEIEPLRDPKQRRDICWVTGKSGCGKSSFARKFAVRYRETWPDRPIIVLSHLDGDETLLPKNDWVNIKRIKTRSLVDTPLEKDELTKCLIICDDIDGLPKEDHAAVLKMIDIVAMQGRHYHTSLVVTSHVPTNYKQTRVMLAEASWYVVFPHGASAAAVFYLLNHYGGMDKDDVALARALPSRWVALRQSYPPVVVWNQGAAMLGSIPGEIDEEEEAKMKGRKRRKRGQTNDAEDDDPRTENKKDPQSAARDIRHYLSQLVEGRWKTASPSQQ